MNRSVPSVLSLALLAGLCPSPGAHAQEFNTPKFHMWGAYPAGHTPSTPMVRKIVQQSLFYNQFYNNPVALAQTIGAEIATDDRKAEPDLDAALLDCVGSHRVTPTAGR
jgi:hypothetical protein